VSNQAPTPDLHATRDALASEVAELRRTLGALSAACEERRRAGAAPRGFAHGLLLGGVAALLVGAAGTVLCMLMLGQILSHD